MQEHVEFILSSAMNFLMLTNVVPGSWKKLYIFPYGSLKVKQSLAALKVYMYAKGKNHSLFDPPVVHNIRRSKNIDKTATGNIYFRPNYRPQV